MGSSTAKSRGRSQAHRCIFKLTYGTGLCMNALLRLKISDLRIRDRVHRVLCDALDLEP